MLAAWVGPMGGGKTAGMTYTLFKDRWQSLMAHRPRNILANYRLRFPYQPLDINWLLDPLNTQIQGASLGIDEIWLFLEGRASGSKKNRAISQILLQSRKRDVDVYGTSQTFKQIDIRFRQNCDYVVMCSTRRDVLFLRIFNRDTQQWTRAAVYIKPIWSLYDTTQLIDPMTRLDDPLNGTLGPASPLVHATPRTKKERKAIGIRDPAQDEAEAAAIIQGLRRQGKTHGLDEDLQALQAVQEDRHGPIREAA